MALARFSKSQKPFFRSSTYWNAYYKNSSIWPPFLLLFFHSSFQPSTRNISPTTFGFSVCGRAGKASPPRTTSLPSSNLPAHIHRPGRHHSSFTSSSSSNTRNIHSQTVVSAVPSIRAEGRRVSKMGRSSWLMPSRFLTMNVSWPPWRPRRRSWWIANLRMRMVWRRCWVVTGGFWLP